MVFTTGVYLSQRSNRSVSFVTSLLRSRFRDVTQRSPLRGALRDIPEDGCEGDYFVTFLLWKL